MENNQNDIFSKEYAIRQETRVDKASSDLEDSIEQLKEDYEIGSETKSQEEPKNHDRISKPEVEIDTQKYGLGKPRRVIIRGKLTHD